MTRPSIRIASIDILRALTMLLMIFVNDLWSLRDIPLWLEHTPAEADDMGLADTVFPAFLFIVGMSIPLSVLQRRNKGESNLIIWFHVVERSFALIVMGLFLMNAEVLHPAATGISRNAWYVISVLCFFVLWNSWPKTMNKWIVRVLKFIAVAALAYLAYICRGGEGEADQRFTHYWWGILGLIGWAYFVSATIYVWAKGNRWICLIAWLVFLLICITHHAGLIPHHPFLQMILSPIGEGAMPAFVMGGVLTTLVVLHFRSNNQQRKMFVFLVIAAIVLFLAGVYLRQHWGISKIRATPAWVLICSAITIAVFIPLYWLADIKGKGSWFTIIKPAGTNTLLCYLLPYLAYVLMNATKFHLPASLTTGGVGLIKSFIFSFLVIQAAGVLGKLGLRLKL